MQDLPISKELKEEIEVNQNHLKNAIRKHQMLIGKLKDDPESIDVRKGIESVQQEIVSVGLVQKSIIERLRKALKQYDKSIHENNVTAALEEKRNNFTNALIRARKQIINVRPVSTLSYNGTEESQDIVSGNISPEPYVFNPLHPHDMTQKNFLLYHGLCTHDIYKELVNKRAERKRRSTANPQFLYGGKGSDVYSKRKRSAYLLALSPPNTRQAVKNRIKVERSLSSPGKSNSPPESPVETPKKLPPLFPSIPNLPSGLTIERIISSKSLPEERCCCVCRSGGGSLSVCESCSNWFHISCYNRPLVQTPRKCPRCMSNKDNSRIVGPLSVTIAQEKVQEKEKLSELNRQLSAELTQLQDRHSQLVISLRDQKKQQKQLVNTHDSTKTKIKDILDFISNIKNRSCTNSENEDNKNDDSVETSVEV